MLVVADCLEFVCHVVDDHVEFEDFVHHVVFCGGCECVGWFVDPALFDVVGVVVGLVVHVCGDLGWLFMFVARLGGDASVVVERFPGVRHVLSEVFFDFGCECTDFSLCVFCCSETDEVHEGACVDCPIEFGVCSHGEDDAGEFFGDVVGE